MRSVPARLAVRLLLSISVLLTAPVRAIAQVVAAAVAQSQDIADRIRALLAAGGSASFSLQELDATGLRAFYDSRQYQPAWTASTAALANANLVLAALEHADEEGLQSDRYRLGEIDLRHKADTVQTAAEYEILLTDSALRYARDLRQGQAGLRDLDADVGLLPDLFDPASDLGQALQANRLADFLASLPPPQPGYQHLKAALARYRAIAANGGAAQPSETDAKAKVRDRVAVENSTSAGEDIDLDPAVGDSEKEHAPPANGHAGAQAPAAPDMPSDFRVQQIIANMERWRWVPRSFGSRYVNVNAASATLEVIDNGNVVLTSPTIVGKPDTRTPVFMAVATAFTVNPSWNIPTQIVRHEILPKARGNPGYLARHRIVRSSGGFRQLPGRGNALGLLKMEMPNQFDAYLHDTPSRSLFVEDERHLSHGCIRVQQIQPLASFALTNDTDSGLKRIRSLIATGASRRILLDNPLPVFVLYWTAIADADGAVNFHPDVYGRDQRLIAALAGQRLSNRVTMNFGTTGRN
jgi:murein L,D-transpeptidase YcbB/YkuD